MIVSVQQWLRCNNETARAVSRRNVKRLKCWRRVYPANNTTSRFPSDTWLQHGSIQALA